MKRSLIESRLRSIPKALQEKIEQAPVPYFVLGVIVGCVFILLYKLLVTVIILGAMVIGALWFFGEEDGVGKSEGMGGGSSNPEVVNENDEVI